MINTVIFDMDGVLLDSEPIHQKVNLHYFRSLGVSVSQDFYDQNFIGLPLLQMLNKLKQKHGLDKDVLVMLEECSELLRNEFKQSELTPKVGVVELLQSLKQAGCNLAVGSSSSPDLIEFIIEKLGLKQFFQHLVSGYQVERGKPYPDLFLKIAELFQVTAENCVVIEDSSLGLEAAYRAGMSAVGVDNDGAGQDMSRARLIVSSFVEPEREKIFRILKSW